mgnify:CR=1 FL=1
MHVDSLVALRTLNAWAVIRYSVQGDRWLGKMYVRIAEVVGSSEIQFKMIMAFIEKELLPRNIKAGQLSGEIFKTSEHSCFVVSRFNSKPDADRIMSIMKAELQDIKGTNKIRLMEGERILHMHE